jgi:hypothetical protein
VPAAPRPSSPCAAQRRFACHAAHAFGQGAWTGGGYAAGNTQPLVLCEPRFASLAQKPTKDKEHAPRHAIDGLNHALHLLQACAASAALERIRPAIAAVRVALHRAQKRRDAQAPSGRAFTIQPVRMQYVRGQPLRSPNGLRCAYVGRPTAFGNPFRVGQASTPTRKQAVEAYRSYILARPTLIAKVRAELRGKNLACWCPCDGHPCHADVLLEIANGQAGSA